MAGGFSFLALQSQRFTLRRTPGSDCGSDPCPRPEVHGPREPRLSHAELRWPGPEPGLRPGAGTRGPHRRLKHVNVTLGLSRCQPPCGNKDKTLLSQPLYPSGGHPHACARAQARGSLSALSPAATQSGPSPGLLAPRPTWVPSSATSLHLPCSRPDSRCSGFSTRLSESRPHRLPRVPSRSPGVCFPPRYQCDSFSKYNL